MGVGQPLKVSLGLKRAHTLKKLKFASPHPAPRLILPAYFQCVFKKPEEIKCGVIIASIYSCSLGQNNILSR